MQSYKNPTDLHMLKALCPQYMNTSMRWCHLLRSYVFEIASHLYQSVCACTKDPNAGNQVVRLVFNRGLVVNFYALNDYLGERGMLQFVGETRNDKLDLELDMNTNWTAYLTENRGEMTCCTDNRRIARNGYVMGCIRRKVYAWMSSKCWCVKGYATKFSDRGASSSTTHTMIVPASADLKVTRAFYPYTLCTSRPPVCPYAEFYAYDRYVSVHQGSSKKTDSTLNTLVDEVTQNNCYQKAELLAAALCVLEHCSPKRAAPSEGHSEEAQTPNRKRIRNC